MVTITVMARRAATCVALTAVIASVVALTACGSVALPSAPVLTQPPCERDLPTHPTKPRATQGPGGSTYIQKLDPLVADHVASAELCRYRDRTLIGSDLLSEANIRAVGRLLNALPADSPRTCDEPKPGEIEDVIDLHTAAESRIFVQHGGCRSVYAIGQVRRTSKDLLAWLDDTAGIR